MININPAPNPSSSSLVQPETSALRKTYAPPVSGLITNVPMAAQSNGSAVILENFWPTSTSIEPRGGIDLRSIISGSVKSLFQYAASSVFFAADDNNVYEFSSATAAGSSLSAVISGQTSGDYSFLEMQTDGGSFLTIVNGEDNAKIYDGSSWSDLSITGVDSSRLSNIWSHRNRTFYIQKHTMNAWYLGVNSISGAASKLPLAGVFNRGGALIFGSTWSSDSGSGMDDRCVFVTDQGEFAVYSGGNPSDTNDWSLVGVYDIGKPLGKNAFIRVGGDLIIATDSGLIPLSSAISKDQTQLELSSLSRSISPDWDARTILETSSPNWKLVKWVKRGMAIVAPISGINYCFVVNLETGAWSKFTGWNIQSIENLGDSLYFGDSNGNIFACDVGGLDNGEVFECRACLAFDHLNAFGALKYASSMRTIWRYVVDFNVSYSIGTDYNPSFRTTPSTPITNSSQDAQWDTSSWDETPWGTDSAGYEIKEDFRTISASGRVLAPQIQLLSGQPHKLNCELLSIHLEYSLGDA